MSYLTLPRDQLDRAFELRRERREAMQSFAGGDRDAGDRAIRASAELDVLLATTPRVSAKAKPKEPSWAGWHLPDDWVEIEEEDDQEAEVERTGLRLARQDPGAAREALEAERDSLRYRDGEEVHARHTTLNRIERQMGRDAL